MYGNGKPYGKAEFDKLLRGKLGNRCNEKGSSKEADVKGEPRRLEGGVISLVLFRVKLPLKNRHDCV